MFISREISNGREIIMFDFIFCVGFVSVFFFAITILYIAFMCLMFVVYKLDNGKMNFREYVKYW